MSFSDFSFVPEAYGLLSFALQAQRSQVLHTRSLVGEALIIVAGQNKIVIRTTVRAKRDSDALRFWILHQFRASGSSRPLHIFSNIHSPIADDDHVYSTCL